MISITRWKPLSDYELEHGLGSFPVGFSAIFFLFGVFGYMIPHSGYFYNKIYPLPLWCIIIESIARFMGSVRNDKHVVFKAPFNIEDLRSQRI